MGNIKGSMDIEMGNSQDCSKATNRENTTIPINETKEYSVNGLTELVIEENNEIDNTSNTLDTPNQIINHEIRKTNHGIEKECVEWRNKNEPIHNETPEEIIVSIPLCDINTVFTDVKIRHMRERNQVQDANIINQAMNHNAHENAVQTYGANSGESNPNHPNGNNENENRETPEENNVNNENSNNTGLNRVNTNSNENIEEVIDNIRTYILEDDLNVSNRVNRNLYYCDLFINGTYLVILLVLFIALAVDFSRKSASRNETYMKCQCAFLLIVFFTHICLKIYDLHRTLKRKETPRGFKIFESYFHAFAMILSLFCLYIYIFHSKTYPINATFATAIIAAIVYYFTSVVLYIILRILLLIFILVILLLRRKKPTPKRILRKLKIMKYAEFKIFCEEGKFLKDNYFYFEEDTNETKETQLKKEKEHEEKDGESECTEKGNHKDYLNNREEEVAENENDRRNKINGEDKWSHSTITQPYFLGRTKSKLKKEEEQESEEKRSDKQKKVKRREEDENDWSRKEEGIIILDTEIEERKVLEMKTESVESNQNNTIEQTNLRENSEHTNNYNRSTIAENEEKNDVVEMRGMLHFVKTLLKRKHMQKEIDIKMSDKLDESCVHIDIENINMTCSVCCTDYVEDDEICVLPCNYLHFFHKKCIFTWLKKNNECPFCRTNVESLFKKKRWSKRNRTMSK